MNLSPKQREALNLVADGRFVPCLVKEDDGWHARWRAIGVAVADECLDGWVDEYVREAAVTRLSEDAEDQKHETLHDAWMLALRSRTGLVRWDDAACRAFASELEDWSGSAEEDADARRNIVFSFRADGTGDTLPRFVVSCAVPKGKRGLKALGQAAYVWGPLAGLKASDAAPRSLRVAVTQAEAEDLIRRGARNLRDAGYGVEGVDLSVPVTAEAEISADEPGGRVIGQPTGFKLTVRVAGEPVTAEEIRFLLDQGSSFVCFRDRWIEVDRGILKEALRALEKGAGRNMNVLGFALGIGHVGRLELEEVRTHGWLRGLVGELRAAGRLDGLDATGRPEGFCGELRDYQRQGVAWLRFLTEHGFGALLADDMGLGKTIQVIAWILSSRIRSRIPAPSPVLIVAPLTLLSNWRHEFAKFAPGLKILVHQGEGRHVASGFRRAVAASDVVLTSYNLLVKEHVSFAEIEWDALVLDEAQAIKNPDTQVARSVCALLPPKRICLTGTPVENSIADIWSLEEFLNPGFLGARKAFADRFVKPIAADGGGVAARRLRHALEPFVLRRLKSDRRIAAELGEKREIREYCALTPAQRREYEAALMDFRSRDRAQGDVFALLTTLKLICDGAGKLERLCELAETIFAAGESVLVFTQYAKVGLWLRTELAKRFGRTFPFLHGGLSAREREAAVGAFQASRRPNLFLLSLKAGGFGLNLTKATHVIHFDRWWNPAVENQATDRAHRIGQDRTVFVHLFITAGTLEERVDEMLQRKESLKTVIEGGEAFWKAVSLEDEP